MFNHLKGKIAGIQKGFLILETGGIGWQLFVSDKTAAVLSGTNDEVTVYTYLNVREDALELFGFHSIDELEMFKLLITISGVGPKVALSILSSLDTTILTDCILSGDAKTISTAQGIGLKTAQKIILELKDKVVRDNASFAFAGKASVSVQNSDIKEAVNALIVLGFPLKIATDTVHSVATPDMNLQQMISLSLQKLSDNGAK